MAQERERPLQQNRSWNAPKPPQGTVPRPGLVELVERGVQKGMVIVSGPAGSGKTLLLAQWAAQRSQFPAWLSAEPEDADPEQFWSRVLGALQACPWVSPDSLLGTMTSPPLFDQRFVSQLLQSCEQQPWPVVLVLDDLHLLTGSAALASLAVATRRGLGNLRLVIATRADPTLPLQRLRLGDRLTELNAADLAFDQTEAVQLLAQHDIHLRPDQLKTLLARTEGWAAGVRLAALALRDQDDLDAAVAALAGDQRTVADYFMEEVLAQLEPELTEFLLRTCVSRRICPDLANTLTGRTDGQSVLADLERENLFVVALDDRRYWYRYHHMFGDLLRRRLAAEGEHLREALHRLAAGWFAGRGELLEAARHLAEAGAWNDLARFVMRAAGARMLGVDRHALVELIGRVPPELILVDPELSTAAAIAAYAEYDAAGVHAHASRARELLSGLGREDLAVTEAVLTTLEAVAAWMEGDAEKEIAWATDALARMERLTPAEMPALPAYRMGTTTVLGMGMLWTGRLDQADALLTGTLRAVSEAQAMTAVLAVHVYGNLAVLRSFQGALHEAEHEAQRALAAAEASGWLYLPQSTMAYLAVALVALMRGEEEACALAIERGRACLGDLGDRFTETGLWLTRARLDLATGNPARAASDLAELRRRTDGWPMPWFLRRWTELVELEAALEGDDRAASAEALSRLQAGWGSARPEPHRIVLVARSALAARDPVRCLDLLSPLTTSAATDLVPTIDAWLLTALSHNELRNDADAAVALENALSLAEPEGIVRPFLLSNDREKSLLLRHQQTIGTHWSFVNMLVQRLGGREPGLTSGVELLEPLTGRERSVMQLLPTMMSNAEIGEELYVSVNTVKVHLRSLYRKLGVRTRREAVARARELGLVGALGPPPSAVDGGQPAAAAGDGLGGTVAPARQRRLGNARG